MCHLWSVVVVNLPDKLELKGRKQPAVRKGKAVAVEYPTAELSEVLQDALQELFAKVGSCYVLPCH